MDPTPIQIDCPSCAQPLSLKFCAHHSGSLSHFVHGGLPAFAHLDSKVFGALPHLLRHPGLLTARDWPGCHRVRIRPLRLPIVAAVQHPLVPRASAPLSERLRGIFAVAQYLPGGLLAPAPWFTFRRQRPWYLRLLTSSPRTGLTFPVTSLAIAPLAYICFFLRRLYGESIGKAFPLQFAHIAAEGSFFWTAYSIPH